MLGSPERLDHAVGGGQLGAVALAVIEGQAIAFETLAAGNGQTGGGIESTGKENDGFLHHGARIYPKFQLSAGICLFLRYNFPL
jgi:hypothetical protein